MFGRIAVAGFAAFLAFVPVSPGTETSALVPAPMPRQAFGASFDATLSAIAATPEKSEAVPDAASGGEPFGLRAEPIVGGDILQKWRAVEAAVGNDRVVLAACRRDAGTCPSAARNFLAVIAAGQAQTGRARVGLINRAINLAITPMSDIAQWGEEDHWSAPLETFSTGHGDCEDYAIAKYVALIEAGVPAADVKLVIIRNKTLGEDHAVTAVRLDGRWVILDNRWLALVDDADLQQAAPLFVLDQDGARRLAPDLSAGLHRQTTPASLIF
jgi:predicted transglutaminase-like cysteine proteinase